MLGSYGVQGLRFAVRDAAAEVVATGPIRRVHAGLAMHNTEARLAYSDLDLTLGSRMRVSELGDNVVNVVHGGFMPHGGDATAGSVNGIYAAPRLPPANIGRHADALARLALTWARGVRRPASNVSRYNPRCESKPSPRAFRSVRRKLWAAVVKGGWMEELQEQAKSQAKPGARKPGKPCKARLRWSTRKPNGTGTARVDCHWGWDRVQPLSLAAAAAGLAPLVLAEILPCREV